MNRFAETKKIDAANAALIVVDMQEKLVPAQSRASLVKSCETLIKGCRILNVPVLCTQQYTKGLGHTIPQIVEAGTAIVGSAPGRETAHSTANPESVFPFIEKTSFSVMGEPEFQRQLEHLEKHDLILCGIEAHVCVLQSALDLLDEDYGVFLISDAVSSRHGEDYLSALNRAEGAGAVVTTTETILFELMRDARHPMFKEISKLVK
ncbi:MAG: isochorismatase family protein [Clostridiales Family XIII bacterium]|jgi:nicotinamidase-related amidase|nr:isochorismatase family protein [Clostridiales Family XIII bacterium]